MAQEHLSQLENELEEVRALLAEKERDATKAAELGKGLLDTNHDLQNRLEEIGEEYAEKIEALEQERYSLQLKVDCQKSTINAIQHEVESTRSHLEHEHALKQQRLEEVYSKKVHDVTSFNEDLKSEIEKLEMHVRNYREKVQKLEEAMEKLTKDPGASGSGNTTFLQHELNDLEQMVTQEKAHNEELQLQLLDSESNVEMLQVETSALSQKVEALEEECEERSRQANSWYQALQEAKEQKAELNAQMEMMKLEMMGNHHHSTGNSLFGEVEDRRLDAERKLISIQVKHESLVKTHSTMRQQMKKMKAEMTALLCQYGATTADAAHAQRLQRALDQSRSETHTLLSKLHKLERQQADTGSSHEKQRCMAAFTNFGDKREYIQFLEQELEHTKKDKDSLVKEVDMKRTQLLWETNKLSEAEAKLHHSEQEQAKLKKEVTKLKLRLQETMEKMDQVTIVCKQLEGDNKLLEEQLKLRGRRSCHPSRRTSNADSSKTSSQGLSNETPASSTSSLDSSNDSKQEPTTTTGNAGSQLPKKEINILEDLDKEFNKQRLEMGMEEGQQTGVISPKRATSLMKSLDSENSQTGGKETSNSPLLPLRVVRVKNPNVNQCPQQ